MSSPSAISGTQSVHPLFQAILDSPQDHYLKLVYSDFLEEQGKSAEALAWKWIGEKKKSPDLYDDWFDWWEFNGRLNSNLGSEIFRGLQRAGSYKIQSEAYLDLVRVLVENPQFMEEGEK